MTRPHRRLAPDATAAERLSAGVERLNALHRFARVSRSTKAAQALEVPERPAFFSAGGHP